MNPVLSWVRPNIAAMSAYESARSLMLDGTVFLDANEPPCSPVENTCLNRYPEPQPRILLERFSQIYKVDSSQLLMGRGSDEAIDLLVRAFCEPSRDQILICPPTYGMYEVSAKIQGAQVLKVPMLLNFDEFRLDEDRIQEVLASSNSIKMMFLCSPNNPTGTALSSDTLLRICRMTQNKCILVIDEAYIEFVKDGSFLSYFSEMGLQFPHLVVLRTLSKAWASAGARFGLVIAQKELIQVLQKIRAPYPLSMPTVQTVLEVTDETHRFLLQSRVQTNRVEIEKMRTRLLETNGVQKVYSSAANFLLVKFVESKKVFEGLRSKGIIVRDRSKEVGLENCIRITLGTGEENQILISALQEMAL